MKQDKLDRIIHNQGTTIQFLIFIGLLTFSGIFMLGSMISEILEAPVLETYLYIVAWVFFIAALVVFIKSVIYESKYYKKQNGK